MKKKHPVIMFLGSGHLVEGIFEPEHLRFEIMV